MGHIVESIGIHSQLGQREAKQDKTIAKHTSLNF